MLDSLGLELDTVSCEPPDVGSRNQTLLLMKQQVFLTVEPYYQSLVILGFCLFVFDFPRQNCSV